MAFRLRAHRSSASGSLNLTFKRAIQCVDRIGAAADPRFVDFIVMAFVSLLQIGEFRSMGAFLPRAMQFARRQGRRDKVCAVLCHMGMLSWFEGRYAEGQIQCEEALEIATDFGSVPLVFGAKLMLAGELHGIGNVTRAIALLMELQGHAERQTHDRSLGDPLYSRLCRSKLSVLVPGGGGALRRGPSAWRAGSRDRQGRSRTLFRGALAPWHGPEFHKVEPRSRRGRICSNAQTL